MMDSLQNLILLLNRLPSIGMKSARRIAYFLLEDDRMSEELAKELLTFREHIYRCPICATYSEGDSCGYCNDASRDSRTICIVEKPADAITIENSGAYRGLYHVLGGVLSPLDGMGPDELNIKELLKRVSNNALSEIILATSLSMEGDATAYYLESILKEFSFKITRLASGMSVGSYIEYADKQTIARSLEGRRDI